MSKEENIILPVLALGAAVLILSGGGDNKPAQYAPGPAAPASPTDFIRKYWNEAKISQAITTIPAIVTITQGGLESGWGKHAPGFNFFGIKASPGWTGATQMLDTTEYVNGVLTHVKAKFRAYGSVHDGFTDHGRFFIDNQRYHTALQHTADPIQFIKDIAAAGYATDPNYADKLIASMKVVLQVLQRYNLI